MNKDIVWAIARKDLKEIAQNKLVLTPAILIPILFVVVIPVILLLAFRFVPPEQLINASSRAMLARMTPLLPPGLDPKQALAYLVVGTMFAPMFLMLPVMVASIFGADSFAGEKERKTLEALLYTPATDEELFLGKTLFCLLPAVGVTWLSFVVYSLVVNLVGWPIMGKVWFPTLAWWPLMFWVVPSIATLAMAATVLISARVSSFMEAYQSGGSLVLIVLALLAGQATGILSLSVLNSFLVGLVFWGVDWLLVRYAVQKFSRSELISRL